MRWLALAALSACVTPPQATAPVDAGSPPFQVPACTEANARQRIPVADGSWLWCVPGDDGKLDWQAVR